MSDFQAIMYTEIKEFSTLFDSSPQKAQRVKDLNLSIHKRIVPEFNGEILIANDDDTLAIFKSGVDAVSCAMSIQETLTDIPEYELRVGLHWGLIDDIPDEYSSADVKITKRIKSISAPNGICLTGALHDQIENQLEIKTKYLGSQKLIRKHKKSRIFAIIGHGLHIPALDDIHIQLEDESYLRQLLSPVNIILLIIIIIAVISVIALKP